MRFNLSARGGCDNARGYVMHEPKASALRNRERYRVLDPPSALMKPHRHYVVFSKHFSAGHVTFSQSDSR